MQTHRTTRACVFAFAFAVAAPAFAQLPATTAASGDEAIKETTRELFAKGVKASQQQKWDQCRAAFLAALGIQRLPRIAGNLALCEAKMGLYRDAAEHVTMLLNAPEAIASPANRAAAEAVLREAMAKVTTLRISVDRRGADVLVDDKPIGNAPLAMPVFVVPGAHTLVARLDGYVTGRKSLETKAGQAIDVALSLVSLAAPVRDVPVPSPPPRPPRPLWPALATGGLAVVALGVGAGLAGAAQAKRADAESHAAKLAAGPACAGASGDSAECQAMRSAVASHDSMTKAALGSFIAGGAVGIAAVGLGVWKALGPKDEGGKARLQVAPDAGKNGAGVVVLGIW